MSSSTQSQLIKIFVASPSDVQEERETLGSLIREVNDVLAFLAPNHNLRLELMRYETHTYPDYGEAQEVINKQIPEDYDVFVGVMWKRCGTPTSVAESGTIEEFNRAMARREKSGRPIIMFYFCDEPIAPPKGSDFDQYSRVVKFREEVESKGYISTYPARKAFRDHVRAGLLRAVADVVKYKAQEPPLPSDHDAHTAGISQPYEEMLALAHKYDAVRADLPSSSERTRRMSEIKAAMRIEAANAHPELKRFQESNSAGQRLGAVVILERFPNSKENDWLAERLNPDLETPFVGHAAAVALVQAVRSSLSADRGSQEASQSLARCIEKALRLAERNPNDPDRIRVLHVALSELNLHARSAGSSLSAA
jgi:hypothetical protein